MITRRQTLISVSGVAAVAALPGVSRQAMAVEPIKIGFTTALTGPFNEFGEGYKRGVELAIAKINAAGGVLGRPIEIGMMLDDQLVPDRAVQNMRRILDNTDIVALLCPSGSGPTLAIADMVTADGRPIMNPQAQTPTVIYPGGPGTRPRPNMFSVSIQNDVEANYIAAVIGKQFKRVGLLTESTGYGKSGGELIKAEILRLDKDAVVTHESYNQKDQDMTAQLVRVQRAHSEVLMVVGLGADLAVIRKNMTRMGMAIPLYTLAGGLTPPYVEGAGELVIGTRGSHFAKITREPSPPETKEFLDAYKAKYGNDRLWGPDPLHPVPSIAGTVGTGYDSMLLLADAIRRAGTTDAGPVLKAMEATKDFAGANATYSYSPARHDAVSAKDLNVYEYVKQDGRIMLKQLAS